MANTVSKTETNPSNFFNPSLDAEAYNFVARRAQLSFIQLIGNDFNVQPIFFAKQDKVRLDLSYGIHDISASVKDDFVSGIFHYEVVGKIGRRHVMTMKADMIAVYDIPDGAAENESKAFCARVGLFAAYPYFRGLFAHISSMANLELPTLPVLSADPMVRTSGSQTARLGTDEAKKAPPKSKRKGPTKATKREKQPA